MQARFAKASIGKLRRGYMTMASEEYLLNQRDANNMNTIQMTSLYPLKNSSRQSINERPF